MTLAGLVDELRREARRTNERRLVVLAGSREAGVDAAYTVVEAADADPGSVSFVTTREGFRYHRLDPHQADQLLGTTRELVVFDCHEGFSATALGQATGSVDGGGLFVLLVPPLGDLPTQLEALVDQLTAPPFDRSEVGNRFRERVVATLRTHPGVAIATVEIDDSELVVSVDRDGRTHPPDSQRVDPPSPSVRTDTSFPPAAFAACCTADQARAVAGLSVLSEPGQAVVVDADRGRGKTSAAGLAAASLAAAGHELLVTAPAIENTEPLFARAEALLAELDVLSATTDTPRCLTTTTDGRIRFRRPPEAAEHAGEVDAAIVDEAAAIPVALLERFLDTPSVAFCTTVHGYEGTGRGFAVRFRDRLAESQKAVSEIELQEPIRYARGDPVESWLFRTLLLDAESPVDQLVEDATPETVEYRRITQNALAADEQLLRSVFGLLVVAHYRTDPSDLVRLLDAPNIAIRALEHEGHIVSVAVLVREGGLDAELRASIYEGQRVRGNMLPDVLTSQLRDEAAAEPVGYRVMRIATHQAVRSNGLGSQLLDCCHAEFEDRVDWLGVGFGATPRLVDFWAKNGYRTVHLSITANDRSGEHSALMLWPCSAAGHTLANRHMAWFRERIGAMLSDVLSGLDPGVVRAAVAAAGPHAVGSSGGSATVDQLAELSDRDWQVIVGVGYGPGTYEAAPHVFRTVAMAYFLTESTVLSDRQERLLVRKVLQGQTWESVAVALGYESTSQCMREMGTIARSICEQWGGDIVETERQRYD